MGRLNLNPDEPTVRWAQFGRQVELFLEGDIGGFLLKKAQVEIDDALAALKIVDPYDTRAVQKAQNKVKVAESIIEWLAEAINSGQSAMEELKNAEG